MGRAKKSRQSSAELVRRALLVGAGGWGRVWAAMLYAHPRVELVGWYDILPGVADTAAAQLGFEGVVTGSSLTEALDGCGADFLVNLTVPSAHREVAIAAMERGLPVLCEKPMADTLENAVAMMRASERTGCLLVINQQRRYDRNIAAMRRLIDEHLGSLGILNADFYLSHPERPFHQPMRHPLILDMAIHTFDAARYVSSSDPVSVWCEDFNTPWSWWTGHGSAVAVFEMSGGLRFTYRGSWSAQGFGTTWESSWRAIAQSGTVLWDGAETPQVEVMERPGDLTSPRRRIDGFLDAEMVTGLEGSLEAFLTSLDTGVPPMGECHDNFKSLAMVLGAVQSAETCQRVPVGRLLGD